MGDAATSASLKSGDDSAPSILVSSYKTQEQFDAALEAAAQRLARWRGLRLQWYLLTIAGVVLIVLTIIKVIISAISEESGVFIQTSHLSWAWLIGVTWCLLYFRSMRRLSDKIIDRRLCLRCAASLLDAETDEHGNGVCPRCCSVFSLGDYTAPSQNIAALQAAKQRVRDRLPPVLEPPPPQGARPVRIVVPRGGLYRNRTHFDQVMHRAAMRFLTHGRGLVSLQIGLIGGALPATVFFFVAYAIGVEWTLLFGILGIGLLFAAVLIGLTVWAHADAARARLINQRLCLACGYSLHGLRPDERGCGRCPECGRPFHPEEYTAPEGDAENTDWQIARRILFRDLNASIDPDDDAELHWGRSPKIVLIGYPPTVADPQRESVSEFPQCRHCGYSLVGTPRSKRGTGICSECGKPFSLERLHTQLLDSFHPLDRARMEAQTNQPDSDTDP